MIEEIIAMLKATLHTVVNDDEVFELSAKAMRKGFNALVKEGFTEDQAIRILAGQGAVKLSGNG